MRLTSFIATLLIGSSPVLAAGQGDCVRHADSEVRIKSCSQIIGTAPTDAVAYFHRGAAHYAKGDFANALSDYSKAIEIDPAYAAAYDGRGAAYAAKGDYTHALEDVTRATELAKQRTLQAAAMPAPVRDQALKRLAVPKPPARRHSQPQLVTAQPASQPATFEQISHAVFGPMSKGSPN
jgi:tetratricopeptide (TPR) repeat protein